MTTRRLLLPRLAFAALLLALAVPAQGGTQETPEVADPSGDTDLPQLDLSAVWFEATDTDLLVHIDRAAGADAPPPIVVCQDGQCAGASAAVRAVFTVLKPDGTPAPSVAGYSASYVLARVGVDDESLGALVGHMDADGVFTADGAANATVDGASVTITVPRAHAAIGLPDGAAPGEYRISSPWAYSAPMACVPDAGQGAPPAGAPAGCPTLKSQPSGAPEWDRAPDAGYGLDYVFAKPPPAPVDDSTASGKTVTSTTTVTAVQTQTRTMTVDHEVTVTSTPFPITVEEQRAPGVGLAALGLVLGGTLVLRRKLD